MRFFAGGATVSRWALDGDMKFHRLILWAGIFPNDMDFEKGTTLLKDKEVIEVYGKQDPFLTDVRISEMTQLNKKLNLPIKIVQFAGGHEINTETLLELR